MRSKPKTMHAFSWKEFFALMALGLLGYYIWLLIRYFPYPFKQKMEEEGSGKKAFGYPAKAGEENKVSALPAEGPSGQREIPSEMKAPQVAGDQRPALGVRAAREDGQESGKEADVPPVEEESTPIGELAKALCGEIDALILQADAAKKPRGELIYALQQLLDKEVYEPMRGGFFRAKINEHIVMRLERHSSIHLDAEELSGLWIR